MDGELSAGKQDPTFKQLRLVVNFKLICQQNGHVLPFKFENLPMLSKEKVAKPLLCTTFDRYEKF